jgi:hypothetical protein
MERLQRAAILSSLVQKLKEKGDWCGETHIQKTTYFLQELMKTPLGFDFILYKHGPFSFDLNDEITAMLADNLFILQPQPYPYGPSILPGSGSRSLLERYYKTVSQFSKQLDFVAQKLGGKKVTELERLATALFVTFGEDTDKTIEFRAKKINELKPHVTLDEAKEAVFKVDQIIADFKDAFH